MKVYIKDRGGHEYRFTGRYMMLELDSRSTAQLPWKSSRD